MRLKSILNTSYGIRMLSDNSWIGEKIEVHPQF